MIRQGRCSLRREGERGGRHRDNEPETQDSERRHEVRQHITHLVASHRGAVAPRFRKVASSSRRDIARRGRLLSDGSSFSGTHLFGKGNSRFNRQLAHVLWTLEPDQRALRYALSLTPGRSCTWRARHGNSFHAEKSILRAALVEPGRQFIDLGRAVRRRTARRMSGGDRRSMSNSVPMWIGASFAIFDSARSIVEKAAPDMRRQPTSATRGGPGSSVARMISCLRSRRGGRSRRSRRHQPAGEVGQLCTAVFALTVGRIAIEARPRRRCLRSGARRGDRPRAGRSWSASARRQNVDWRVPSAWMTFRRHHVRAQ